MFDLYFPTLAATAAAFLFSFSLTFFAKQTARQIGAIDVPGEARRMHDHPIPRTGGIAVYLTFLVATALFCSASPALFALWTGGCLLFLTGLIDDVFSISVGVRLAAQTTAALIATLGGKATLTGSGDAWSVLVSTLTIVALTNAHNFIDGIDGLCAKIGITEAVAIGVLFLLGNDPGDAFPVFLLATALAGFLPLGHAPARLFLGDCGSTPTGYLLASFALLATGNSRTETALPAGALTVLTPLLIFSVPLADLALAILRRVTSAESPFEPDRRHLHHLLVDAGYSHEDAGAMLVTLAVLSALIGISCRVETLLPFASAGCVAASLLLLWIWKRMSVRRHAHRLRRRLSNPAAGNFLG